MDGELTALKGDLEKAAEISETVALGLAKYPPNVLWPVPRLRKLLRASREQALLRAYVAGIVDGARRSQSYLDEDPGRLDAVVRVVRAGGDIPTPLLGSFPLDKGDFPDPAEWIAACERYGAGYGVGYTTLIYRRALG